MRRVEAAVHRKNDRALRDILDELHITGRTADAVAAIPYLCGDVAVLDEARHLATNAEATAAVERLAAVYELLDRAGVADRVSLDLGEVRSMAYYTGISFHGYAAGLGFDVCSGGRYDGLISLFGADLPAVGFALGVERCMIVAQVQCSVAPQVVVQGSANAAAHHLAAPSPARAGGRDGRQGRTGDALMPWPSGARYIITPDGWPLPPIATDGERTLRRGALEKEIATWTPDRRPAQGACRTMP